MSVFRTKVPAPDGASPPAVLPASPLPGRGCADCQAGMAWHAASVAAQRAALQERVGAALATLKEREADAGAPPTALDGFVFATLGAGFAGASARDALLAGAALAASRALAVAIRRFVDRRWP